MGDKKPPTGHFNVLLALDCETTGLCYNSESPVYNPRTKERHQAVSWGLIVADSETLKPVEKLYVEIKWNDESKKQRKLNPNFGKKAEEIHGLTFEYLEENGMDEEEAVVEIGNLIISYWGAGRSIQTLGHNLCNFDVPFLRDLFLRYEIELNFGNRMYDSNSIGWAAFNTFNSNDLFAAVGLEPRNNHNALEDAWMSLETIRRIRKVFRRVLDDN